MMRVLYTGAFRFPDGDAAGFRVLAAGQLLRDLGCDVTFAGWEAASPASCAPSAQEAFRSVPQGEFRRGTMSLLSRLTGFLRRGERTLEWLRTQPAFDVIIAYNPPALFASCLRAHATTFGTAVIIDSTEWYDGGHLPGGRFGPAAFENWWRMRVEYPKHTHVICISTYLERYFRTQSTVRLPPLLPTASHCDLVQAKRSPATAGLHFVYAGQAGRKDRLGAFLRILPQLGEQIGCRVTLTIAGMTDEELRAICAETGIESAELFRCVTCLGRISRSDVAALYRRSHISLLFRENRQYAWAGFPTKAMESWGAGCVILGNAVGDFATFASDGVDAILLDESELAARLPDVLRSIIEADRFPAMATACHAKAEALFSPDVHRAAVASFLASVVAHFPRAPAMGPNP